MLRPLAEARQEFNRQQIEEPLDEAADAVLGMAEAARPVLDDDLADLEAAGGGQHRDEAVQLAVEADLRNTSARYAFMPQLWSCRCTPVVQLPV